MIDIELIRKNREEVIAKLNTRGDDFTKIIEEIYEVDRLWRETKKELDGLRAKRNEIVKKIAEKKNKREDISSILEESKKIKQEIAKKERREKEFLEKRDSLILRIPNIPESSVPIGKDENDNVEIKREGEVKKRSSDVLAHYDLGEREEVLDFKRGAKLGGHRFTVMRRWAALLERALINFMLDVNTSHGYVEHWVPHLVKREVMEGTGQLPKFEEDLYKADDGLWLIPTAEVSLTNLVRGEIIDESKLPFKYTAYTPCYRREAGEYGRDIKGILRQHQFDKVELVKICSPEDSYKELELMREDAERILKLLELPYRVVELCTVDLGFAAAKTYDLEVWIPSQDKYREISSVSNCEDFQARRMNARIRRGNNFVYPHTLNGSALAVGRTLIAIMENYQEEDGLVIPKKLRDYVRTDYIHF